MKLTQNLRFFAQLWLKALMGMGLERIPRKVWLFVGIIYLLTGSGQFLLIRQGGSLWDSLFLLIGGMWMPGLLAIFLSRDENSPPYKALLRKFPRWGDLLLSLAFPLGVALLSLLFFSFRQPVHFPAVSGSLSVEFALGLALLIFGALGEEIGWRGFLLPKLSHIPRFWRHSLVSLVWTLWHWPFVIFTDYTQSEKHGGTLAFFTLTIMSLGNLMALLQERSASLWTSVLLHASHNFFLLTLLPHFYVKSSESSFWLGEAGLIAGVSYALLYFSFLNWGVKRPPRAP